MKQNNEQVAKAIANLITDNTNYRAVASRPCGTFWAVVVYEVGKPVGSRELFDFVIKN